MAARGKWHLILLCLLLVTCDRQREAPAPPPDGDSVAPARTVEPLSDNEALDVLMALSAAGSGSAVAAPELIAMPELRRYLSVVRADHEALAKELEVIADSLGLTPESHGAADRIRTAASPISAPVDAPADEAVLEQQLTLQRLFLAALDSAVLHGAREPLLGQYATAMRPTVAAHLQRAEQLEQLLQQRAAARPPATTTPAGVRPSPADPAPGAQPAVPAESAAGAPPDTLSSR